MAKGDHIKVKRKGYYHHGIDLGNGTVVHYVGEPGNVFDQEVRVATLDKFLKDGSLERVIEYTSLSPDEIVDRALSYVGKGEGEYHLIFNNCEHFATFCRTGEKRSKQIDKATLGKLRRGIVKTSRKGMAITKAMLHTAFDISKAFKKTFMDE